MTNNLVFFYGYTAPFLFRNLKRRFFYDQAFRIISLQPPIESAPPLRTGIVTDTKSI